jgi:hypothetical protein
MARNQITFYVTDDEMVDLAKRVASIKSCDYYEAGLFDSSDNPKLADHSKLKAFKNYLVVEAGQPIASREVKQKAGGVKYALDQLINPNTMGLMFGGLHNQHHLIVSQIGSATETPESVALMTAFKKALKETSVTVKSIYLSPMAVKMLDDGARLSSAPKGAMEYDLKR